MTVRFNNRENECVKTEDGRTVWLSRSCAVVAEICLYNLEDKTWYILLGKRGPGTPDFQGYFCLPCGYLDWDETLYQGMIREVWEECGLHLPSLCQHPSFRGSNNPDLSNIHSPSLEPWSISDNYRTVKQNISVHYATLIRWQGFPLPDLSTENCEPGEVDELRWIPLDESNQYELAFDHNHRIDQLKERLSQEFVRLAAPNFVSKL